MRYPVTSSWEAFQDGFYSDKFRKRQSAYRAAHGPCGNCGEYEGLLHVRCWWLWLTEERVIKGASDGERQIEPDDPYPSRLSMVRRGVLTLFDPSWWRLCWQERMNPWPFGK